MTMTLRTQSRTSKRGFTLTEIAIVLGIIGLILGAIWVAASAVYNNLRVSKATTELLQIAQAVRSMYATSATVDPAANMAFPFAPTAAGATTTYIQGSVLPADTWTLTGTNYATQNPWAGSISVYGAKVAANDDSFVVAFQGVPTQACIAMLTQTTGTGRDSSLYAYGVQTGTTAPVTADTGTGTVITGPVLASTAQAACAAAASVNMGWQFKLKG